jgi:hypothetical protein
MRVYEAHWSLSQRTLVRAVYSITCPQAIPCPSVIALGEQGRGHLLNPSIQSYKPDVVEVRFSGREKVRDRRYLTRVPRGNHMVSPPNMTNA